MENLTIKFFGLILVLAISLFGCSREPELKVINPERIIDVGTKRIDYKCGDDEISIIVENGNAKVRKFIHLSKSSGRLIADGDIGSIPLERIAHSACIGQEIPLYKKNNLPITINGEWINDDATGWNLTFFDDYSVKETGYSLNISSSDKLSGGWSFDERGSLSIGFDVGKPVFGRRNIVFLDCTFDSVTTFSCQHVDGKHKISYTKK